MSASAPTVKKALRDSGSKSVKFEEATMSSSVVCDKGHGRGLCRDAAIQISKKGKLGRCPQPGCGAQLRYLVKQQYPNVEEEYEYELVKVVRLKSDDQAEDDGFDPMLFKLVRRKSGESWLWPFYWGLNKNEKWHVGQFPPILRHTEFRKMIDEMEQP